MHDNNAGLSSGKSWHSNQHSIWINISKPQPILLQIKQKAIYHEMILSDESLDSSVICTAM